MITKLVRPGRLVTFTLPPWAAVTAWTMARPSPVLPPALDRAESPRTNRSNRAGCRSSRDAGAVVGHAQPTAPGLAPAATATVTVVPGGVCLAALLSRLASTWCSRCSSPSTWTGSSGELEQPAVAGAGRPGVAGGVDGQPGEVHRLLGQRAARVQLGEQQQLVHQHAHPGRLRLDPDSACAMSAGTGPGVPAGQFRVAADGGQRGAQLVAGVSGEPAQPGLAGRAAGQRGLDVPQHPVERGADLADLGARIGVRDPLGQRDLAAGQRQLGDPGGGGRDPAQRPQRQPHEPGAEHPGEQQRGGEDDGLDDLDLAQRRSTWASGRPVTIGRRPACPGDASSR